MSCFQEIVQSNFAIRNGLIRNKLVLRNRFLWPICHLLHKDKELLALRNNFRVTKKFLIANFDCITKIRKKNLIEQWIWTQYQNQYLWPNCILQKCCGDKPHTIYVNNEYSKLINSAYHIFEDWQIVRISKSFDFLLEVEQDHDNLHSTDIQTRARPNLERKNIWNT